jgi:peptide/nickel transport system ATP-binding protein
MSTTDQTQDLLVGTSIEKHFPPAGGAFIRGRGGLVRAVDGVDIRIGRQETLGLVGESGCGKSTTGRLLARLLEPTGGQIVFDGTDISHLSEKVLRPLRRQVQFIFQDPLSSLNPRKSIGAIVGEPLRIQGMGTSSEIADQVKQLLARVGLSAEHYERYPHEFSGGQRQRIGIARALVLRPKLVICDEPVSALDVSVQAQIVNLLMDLQDEFGLSYLFIAHDLAVVRQVSDRVAVMYLGKIVELASRDDLFAHARHPYSVALLGAVPAPDTAHRGKDRIVLHGDLPSAQAPPSGCRFRTRCWLAQDKCAKVEPPLIDIGGGHQVACHFPIEDGATGSVHTGGVQAHVEP